MVADIEMAFQGGSGLHPACPANSCRIEKSGTLKTLGEQSEPRSSPCPSLVKDCNQLYLFHGIVATFPSHRNLLQSRLFLLPTNDFGFSGQMYAQFQAADHSAARNRSKTTVESGLVGNHQTLVFFTQVYAIQEFHPTASPVKLIRKAIFRWGLPGHSSGNQPSQKAITWSTVWSSCQSMRIPTKWTHGCIGNPHFRAVFTRRIKNMFADARVNFKKS